MKNVLHFVAMLCMLYFIPLEWSVAQQRSARGLVTDQDGNPLSGATIAIKGGTTETSTDENGRFNITTANNTVLVISALGYAVQEVTFTGQTVLEIRLASDETQLDEVMVVAYGTARRSTFTGSAATVRSSDFEQQPVTSFEKGLAGRVPGLQISTTSGQAGATSAIRLRGIGSMNASNEPLYVIDGVPVVSGQAGQLSDYVYNSNNVMSTINPNDIESVTVLKDAAASSLYGSRAANGVIIITTKRGKTGAPKFNVKSSLGLSPSWATDNYETADVQDQINTLYSILYDSRIAGGLTPEAANTWVLNRFNTNFGQHGYEFSTPGTSMWEQVQIAGRTDGIENREGRYFDWDDALFRTGKFNTNDISVSGANDNTNYYASLAYTSDKSRAIINDFDRVTGRLNLTQKIGNNLEFGSNVNFTKSTLVGMNDTRNTSTSYLYQTRNLLWPFYWPTSYKTGDPWTARYGSLAQNQLFYNDEWENSSQTSRISAIESLTWNILPELNVKTIFSYDESEIKDLIYYSALHYTGATVNGSVSQMSTNIKKLVSSTTMNYNKSFGMHQVGLLAGFEAEKNETNFLRASGQDMATSASRTVATAGTVSSTAYGWGNNLMSILSRAEYNYDERFFASASYRRDGSSKLGPDARWGDFWSVAGSWNLKKESFLDHVESLHTLRLKASYGVNGTLPTDNFGWRQVIGYTDKYMNQPGGTLSNIPDPNISWETNYNTNLSVEFGLWNNKLFGTVEYYNRDSKDLLQSVPISRITGFNSTLRNIGEINNHGVEVLIGSDLIQRENFRWTLSLNGATLNSSVVSLYDGQDIIWNDPTGGDNRTRFIYREGQSTLALFGLEWAGTDQTNGRNMWFVNNANDQTQGDFLVDGRGATYNFTEAERVIIGNGIAKFNGGINSDITYKDFSLGLNFIYRLGGQLYDAASRDVADDGYYWERIRSQYFVDQTWSPDNPTGSLPVVSGRDLEDVNQISSRHVYDASFLRLKNISLAYTIPPFLLQRARISTARIFFNGSNLLTFSKFKNADPEVNQFSTRGWETPIPKTFTFGLDFSF